MKIKTAEFVISNSDYKLCPKASLPEYAFIGRSNVGKSSLINSLVNKKSSVQHRDQGQGSALNNENFSH